MGKHKMGLTESQRVDVVTAHNLSGGKISRVAKTLKVGWQTARRWLILAGCVEANERLDRPGLAWSCFEVKIDDNWTVFVEAPNWAIACKATAAGIGTVPEEVGRTSRDATDGYDRAFVKVMLPRYMDRSLSIDDLEQYYIDAGVIVQC